MAINISLTSKPSCSRAAVGVRILLIFVNPDASEEMQIATVSADATLTHNK